MYRRQKNISINTEAVSKYASPNGPKAIFLYSITISDIFSCHESDLI